MTREKRVEQLIAAAGGPTRAAELLKVSRATIYSWTKPDARLPFDEMEALARIGGVSLDWIATGYDRRPDLGPQIPKEFLVLYRYEARRGDKLVEIEDAGGDIAFREEWLTSIGISKGNAGLLTVEGDAMAPTIQGGTTVVVDRGVISIAGGGLYAMLHGGSISVRRVQVLRDGSLKLIADNPRYEAELVSAAEVKTLKVAGRVRAAIVTL